MTLRNVEAMKNQGDVVAAGLAIGALADWLPPAAAAASLVYTMLRIAEMPKDKTFGFFANLTYCLREGFHDMTFDIFRPKKKDPKDDE